MTSMSVVDPLTGTYSMPCPAHGTTGVRLSSFRLLDRLPGSAHPAVYRVTFACACGGEHPALLSHDELDWAPLGLGSHDDYVNLMTARSDPLAAELVALATGHILRGEWPWTFFCHLEERARPVTPSAFRVVAAAGASVGLAVCCPVCASTSVNLVSHAHLDVPFTHDRAIAVVAHVFEEDALRSLAEFQAMLSSSSFDERRLSLTGD
jgi:hypothetical protein